MAITVNFKLNHSDERYITKNITTIKDGVTCDIYDPTNRVDPILFVDNADINISTCNYMEIPAFGRKYFITDIIGAAGKTLTIHGHVDVLSSFDAAIRNCDCTAARSTTDYNFYLQDNSRLFNTYTWNQYLDVGEVGSPNLLLITTA